MNKQLDENRSKRKSENSIRKQRIMKRVTVIDLGKDLFNKSALINRTPNFKRKELNKIQDFSLNWGDQLLYSDYSEFNIDELLLIGKELFNETDKKRKILSFGDNHDRKETSADLKASRIRTTKGSKYRTVLNEKGFKRLNRLREFRPISLDKKIITRRWNDTPGPWSPT